MAALWEHFYFTHQIGAVGNTAGNEIFHNEVDDHIFASAPITMVDGICTLYHTGVGFSRVWLTIAHELLTAAEVQAMQLHDSSHWYKWYIAQGPLVFRLRSKRTIPPEHKLWVSVQKLYSASVEDIQVGIDLLMVRHQ